MNKETVEFSIKALKYRIKTLGEYVELQTNIYNSSKEELKSKKAKGMSAGGIGMSISYNEKLTMEMMEESKRKLDKNKPALQGYKKALKELEKELKKM